MEMKMQMGDNEELADNDDKKNPKSEESLNDGSTNADVGMAEDTNKSDKKAVNDGDNQCQDKPVDSPEAKATECESSSASATAAISKALLNIISNFI